MGGQVGCEKKPKSGFVRKEDRGEFGVKPGVVDFSGVAEEMAEEFLVRCMTECL
jgi:hypothetical protein